MDWLDLLILALRLALVAVLYLFVLVVMRFSGRALQARPDVGQSLGLRLIVLEGGNSSLTTGQVIDVSAREATLGRSEEVEVVIADVAVSARHARLSRVARGWVISDLGSTNGTRVNDSRVNGPRPLASGDVLALGSVRLEVVSR